MQSRVPPEPTNYSQYFTLVQESIQLVCIDKCINIDYFESWNTVQGNPTLATELTPLDASENFRIQWPYESPGCIARNIFNPSLLLAFSGNQFGGRILWGILISVAHNSHQRQSAVSASQVEYLAGAGLSVVVSHDKARLPAMRFCKLRGTPTQRPLVA